MALLQTQGVHHITLTGADRQTSIDFWEGVLGMPFIFEQPNLDDPNESHLYFDPGDGRLITIFCDENRKPVHKRTPTDPGCVHHIAFNISKAMKKLKLLLLMSWNSDRAFSPVSLEFVPVLQVFGCSVHNISHPNFPNYQSHHI